jgi:hypothetical protein
MDQECGAGKESFDKNPSTKESQKEGDRKAHSQRSLSIFPWGCLAGTIFCPQTTAVSSEKLEIPTLDLNPN